MPSVANCTSNPGKPSPVWLRIVIPAVFINVIGFISFWIPEKLDSVALGATLLLCAVTFRTAVEMPDTAGTTCSEDFLFVNVMCQAAALFIICCSCNIAMAVRLDRWLQACCG